MPKIKIRLGKGGAKEVTRIASGLADKLIASHGTSKAFVISRLVHEKVFATYKRMERKYPNENVN